MKKFLSKIKIHPAIFYTFTILYLELMARFIITKQVFNPDFIYVIIFSIPFVILCTLLTKLFPKIINRILSILLVLVFTVYFEANFIFKSLDMGILSLSSFALADQAVDFANIVVDTIKKYWYFFITFLVPFLSLIILFRKIDFTRYHKQSIASLFIMFIISYLSTFIYLAPNYKSDDSLYKLYFKEDAAEKIIDNFGLLTYSKVDIKRYLFGYENEIIMGGTDEPIELAPVIEEGEKDYGFNQLELDFDKSTKNKNIQTLNTYFSNVPASNKTEYTFLIF